MLENICKLWIRKRNYNCNSGIENDNLINCENIVSRLEHEYF